MKRFVKHAIQHALSCRRLMVRGPARSGSVALTFDDGPHPQYTERLLAVLGREGVRATFFLVGREVKKYPALARAIVEGGHALGNHSFAHGRPDGMSRRALADDMDLTTAAIQDATGVRTTLFRPPYGTVTLPLLLCAWSRALSVVLWSADSGDSMDEAPPAAFNGAVRSARPGDILLFHDDCERTANELGGVIQSLKSRGLRFARIDDWVRS